MRILVLLRRRRRVGPGQTGPLLQGEELGLPPQSTLLSVPLQSGWVTFRGWNEPTAGPGGTRWRLWDRIWISKFGTFKLREWKKELDSYPFL